METSSRRRRSERDGYSGGGISSDPSLSRSSSSAHLGNGACMMNTSWKDEQHPSFIHFISSFLSENSYRLNFLPISPDFIFNNGGLSVAFIFLTNWDCHNNSTVFSRIDKLKKQFRHFYVVVSLPSKEQNDSFNQLYFKYSMEIGNPAFVQVRDLEMGFEKIVKIAHAHGVCKRDACVSKMKIEVVTVNLPFLLLFIFYSTVLARVSFFFPWKREQAVQGMDMFLRVVTSIPGIDNHDANALIQAVGSIEAIAKASKSCILENTDLSADKAERIIAFFRDPQYHLSPKII